MNGKQIVLDPSNVVAGDVWIPTGPLPPEMREFGAFPNVIDWKPGDVVLLSELHRSRAAQTIVRAQFQCGYEQEDARWHNAVVYLGNGLICEVTASGIRAAQLYAYVRGCLMRVRRDESADSDTRWAIAMNMLTLGQRRNSVVATVFNSLHRWLGTRGVLAGTGDAASSAQAYADAYAMATGKLLGSGKLAGGEITPAFLSHTEVLTDVRTYWLTLRSDNRPPAATPTMTSESPEAVTAALAEQGVVLNAYSALDSGAPLTELRARASELERLRADNPTSRTLYIVLGRLYRKIGEISRAIEVLTEFITNKRVQGTADDNDVATALYNRACYYVVETVTNSSRNSLEFLFESALADLEIALKIAPELAPLAAEDADFHPLQNNSRFQQLVHAAADR